MGTLYLVSTPIGNLDDISIRAIKTLFDVDVIACEDTRRTGVLLKLLHDKYSEFLPELKDKYKSQKLLSFYEQNEKLRSVEIINALTNGLSVALISDAGTPLISDPGYPLVRDCVEEHQIKIVAIPGPSSAVSALIMSGLPTDKFSFVGFPPKKSGNKKTFFQKIKKSKAELKSSTIMFESPHKLIKSLHLMQEVFGDIEIAVFRELTKLHEERIAGSISEVLAVFQKSPPKGEFVIVF